MAFIPIITIAPAVIARNDYTGSLGFSFTAARNLTITYLGRPVGSPFLQTHSVRLWRQSDAVLMGSASISPGAPTLNGWAYSSTGAPVALASGVVYRIASSEYSGGDKWSDFAPLTGYSGADITPGSACYVGTADAYPSITILPGYSYVRPNMYEGDPYSIHHRRRVSQRSIQGIF